MKINYQNKLEEILNNLNGTPTLLLHSCCAPCSSYCLEYLSNFFKITIFYYNPNIDDINEFNKRIEEQKRLINLLNTPNKIEFIEGDYDNEEFKKISKGLEEEKEGGSRCIKCYYLRLNKTAELAKKLNYDYFTTTLSISPYKNASKLNEIGEILEKKYQVNYLYSDFKKKNGYKRSIELSKKYNLYRQDYCGCIYSKIESEKRNELKIHEVKQSN